MFEANVKDVFLFNEYGKVWDLSEATLVVAKNGAALKAYIENMGDLDDMNNVEYDFYKAAHNADMNTNFPIGFQFAYRQAQWDEEYVKMSDTMATALWLSRNAIN